MASSGNMGEQEDLSKIPQWLDFQGDGLYTTFFGPNHYAISKRLLETLGYDVEEFAIEAVKFRALFF